MTRLERADEASLPNARAALYDKVGITTEQQNEMALLRAEAVDQSASSRFLDAAKRCAPSDGSLLLLGPVPSPMQRRAGRQRQQQRFQHR